MGLLDMWVHDTLACWHSSHGLSDSKRDVDCRRGGGGGLGTQRPIHKQSQSLNTYIYGYNLVTKRLFFKFILTFWERSPPEFSKRMYWLSMTTEHILKEPRIREPVLPPAQPDGYLINHNERQ